MSNSSIWVLIAGDNDAAIWASENGASHLLRVIRQDDIAEIAEDEEHEFELRRDFAWQLMAELSRGAEGGACDGIIFIAAKEMLHTLYGVMVPEVERLLVAEIPGAPATIAAIPHEPVSMVAWGTLQ